MREAALEFQNSLFFSLLASSPLRGDRRRESCRVGDRREANAETEASAKWLLLERSLCALVSARMKAHRRSRRAKSDIAQSGIAERLIGTLRRECLDHVVVFDERHFAPCALRVRGLLNQTRPHRSLRKDAPLRRAIQRIGHVAAIPILGGLHHQYVRI